MAAYGEYNVYNPLFSAIYLAPDATRAENLEGKGHGRLEVHEIYGLDLSNISLVVLSASQTQLDQMSTGDELVALTRAFFFAGTPSIITSLWAVDDDATSLLMARFYTHLQGGMSKAAALRLAQLDTLEEFPAPYFWAGFVLSGNGGDAELSEVLISHPTATPPSAISGSPNESWEFLPWKWLIGVSGFFPGIGRFGNQSGCKLV